MHKSFVIAVFLLLSPITMAQTAIDPVMTEQRDAAFGYLATTHYLVGRIGRDCLTILSRAESAQDFVRIWQSRNGPYVSAAAKYMEKRLDELEASGATDSRAAMMAAIQNKAQVSADGVLQSWLQKGAKEDVCQRSVALVDLGALDISPKTPMFNELQALVDWAAK